MKIAIENPIFLDLKENNIQPIADDEVFVKLPTADAYAVSNWGRMYSIKRRKILSPQLYGNPKQPLRPSYRIKDKSGSYKNYLAHRLVGEVFVKNPNPNKYYEIHHHIKDSSDIGFNYYKNLQWTEKSEHKMLDSGRKVYIYNPEKGTLRNFKSLDTLCSYLHLTRDEIRNSIYFSEPKFKLDKNIYVHEVISRHGTPIYIAIEDTAETEINIAEGLALGGLLLLGGWIWLKEKLKSYRQ